MFWTLNTSSETKQYSFKSSLVTRTPVKWLTKVPLHKCTSVCLLLCFYFIFAIQVHPKLRNINFHDVTHSLISRNSREQIFVVQISLFIVTFFSLISQILSLMQFSKPSNKSTYTLALHHVSICGVPPSYVTCWMLVHAYATSPGKAK